MTDIWKRPYQIWKRPYQHPNEVFCDEDRISIRPLRPDDAEGLAWYFRRLSPATSYQRFHGFRSELSQTELRRMTNPTFPAQVGIVATMRGSVGLEDQIVGEAHFVADCASGVAELGISVADEHQGSGIGGRLLESLVKWARSADLARMDAEVLAGNRDALRFLTGRGFRPEGRPANGVRRVLLPIQAAAYDCSWTNDDAIEEIKRRAYALYLARGAQDGHELGDWLAAEREVCGVSAR